MEPGEIVDGRYRIIELLGEGGMGAVYIVEHVHMRKRMALKVLHADMTSPEMLTRFEREAMAAAHIDHPNVASASDFGHTADGSLFMVLEYIDGQSLRSALDAGPMPEVRALSIARQIGSALAKAHELGIVHRDLKPENVMLVAKDGVELVKVLDFGIAKMTVDTLTGDEKPGQVLTKIGAVFGTPEYMPPEQAQGQAVDSRADLYSLGIMIYEMLAGVRPFVAEEQIQVLVAHVTEAPLPLRTKAPPGISLQTETLVHALLEKSPDARPQTAKEVVATLDAILGNETPAPVSMVAPGSSRALSPERLVSAGFAKTQLPAKASRSLRLISRVPAPARRIPAALMRLPKPVLAMIAVGVLAVPLVFIVGIGALIHRSGSTPTVSVSGIAPRPPPKKEDLAPDGEIEKAKLGGAPALIELWSRFPKDGRVGHAVVVAYVTNRQWADAVRSVTRLVDVDPAMALNADVRDACTSAVTEGSTADVDVAIGVMENLGAPGVDMLLDLQGRSTLTAPTRAKLQSSLEKPDVRAHANDAAAITIDLRAAKKCEDKKALLDRAKRDGDSRTLVVLTGLQNRGGCGFLGMKDCWGCLRKDKDLDDAVSALQGRR